MGQRHKHADVIIAWAEGEDVQIWDDRAKRWWGVLTPILLRRSKIPHQATCQEVQGGAV